jgi:UDP-glucose 4-epimerase
MALQSKKIPIYGNGLQLRNFSYIDDSVNALLLAAINDNANGNSMFAVSDNQYTIKDITIMITEIIGGDIIFVPWPQERKSIEVGDAVISNNKIKKILDWSPLYNLEDSLLLTKIFYVDKLKYYL